MNVLAKKTFKYCLSPLVLNFVLSSLCSAQLDLVKEINENPLVTFEEASYLWTAVVLVEAV